MKPAPDRKSLLKRMEASDNRGALLVEFAFVMPIIALIFVIIIDGGLAIREHQLLQNAAREGARFASLPPAAKTDADIQLRVINYCAQEGIVITAGMITIDQSYPIALSGGLTASGSMVSVTTTRQMLILGAPILPSGNITLTGRAIFRNLY